MSDQKIDTPPDRHFAIIDFEASSLDENSYPIEVGVAIYRDGAIQSWSSLIRATREWVARDAWSKRSERVHGISRDELAAAPAASDVVARLEHWACGFEQLYCDGGSYDQHWLDELFAGSVRAPTFSLADIKLLIEANQRDQYAAAIERTAALHRAEADARRLVDAIMAARDGPVTQHSRRYAGIERIS